MNSKTINNLERNEIKELVVKAASPFMKIYSYNNYAE